MVPAVHIVPPMSRRTFHLSLDGRPCKVQVEHGYWSARRVVRVDGVEVLRVEPRSLRERDDLWQTSTEHPFEIGAHHLVLRVRPGMVTYDLELFVEAADLFIPFDEETIAFTGWAPGPLDLRRVTLQDGPEVEFANDMPVRWRRLPPGTYVLVRGHLSRVIFDMRETSAAAN